MRAMNTIAAKQARSEMVRYRPPYGGRGGAGSKGSTNSHSWSGTRSSARLVMARDPARPTPKERNDVLGHVGGTTGEGHAARSAAATVISSARG